MNPIVEKILDRADDYRCADYEDRWEKRQALRAAIEQALGQGEPVAYQYRMRPTWGSRGANWGPWEECSRGKYEDCKKAPVVNDWEHEARALYTAPQPPQQTAEWADLPPEEIKALVNLPGAGRPRTAIEMAYAVQAKLRELNGGTK